ncbi:MAG: CHAT domain-containing protein, partial [Blastocatellia bacterium]
MDKEEPQKRILFLAACPKNTPRLRLDEEIRQIDNALRSSNERESFGLHVKFAVTPKEWVQALLEVSPQIVHFAGHGSPDGGLALESSNGRSKLIKPKALEELFEPFAQEVNCVLLNACYSEPQARGIATNINYVMGMERAVTDKAAIAFADGFY